MKQIFIIRAAGNELANQLWNCASVYAYALERGYRLVNPAFFEYSEYFTMRSSPSRLFRLLFAKPFKDYTKRKFSLKRRIWRKLYSWYAGWQLWRFGNDVIASPATDPYYLPPSAAPDAKLASLEKRSKTVPLDGWLFRNPTGLEKHRTAIRSYIQPRPDIQASIDRQISEIRSRFDRVIGIHIRQGDYKTWRGGAYFLDQRRVREVIDEYISKFSVNTDRACFFIASDGRVDEKLFEGLHIVVSANNAVTDLFLLSRTDAILGSNSTFGAFASYIGDIPLIVMKKEPMDWNYYADKKRYFQNKYCEMVHF